jgi:hypothetical protein
MSCASSFEEYAESFGLNDIEKVFGIEDIQVDLKVYVKNFASRLSPEVEGRLSALLKTALGHPGQTLQIAFKAEIVDGELHLVVPLGVTCELCGKTYPEELLRGEITEEALNQHDRNLSKFIGILDKPGESWDKSFLVCSDCYAPVWKANQAGIAACNRISRELALKCLKKAIQKFMTATSIDPSA